LIEVDEYVPLRFRTQERPLGAKYLRLGDQSRALLELLIDPLVGTLRGLTITSFESLSTWPKIEVQGEMSQGLPVFGFSWENKNRIESGVRFSVATDGDDVLVFWRDVEECNAAVFSGRVQFLTVADKLAAVRFQGLSSAQMLVFASHAAGR